MIAGLQWDYLKKRLDTQHQPSLIETRAETHMGTQIGLRRCLTLSNRRSGSTASYSALRRIASASIAVSFKPDTNVHLLLETTVISLDARRKSRQAGYSSQQKQQSLTSLRKNPRIHGDGPIEYAKRHEDPPFYVCNCVRYYLGQDEVEQPLTDGTRDNIKLIYPRREDFNEIGPGYISFRQGKLLEPRAYQANWSLKQVIHSCFEIKRGNRSCSGFRDLASWVGRERIVRHNQCDYQVLDAHAIGVPCERSFAGHGFHLMSP